MHPIVKLFLILVVILVVVVVWGRVVGRRDPDRELVGLTDDLRAKVSREISAGHKINACLLYTSPSPRDGLLSRMPSSA